MVCGGFSCSKNALITLNILYIIVSIIVIATAAYARVVAIIVSPGTVSGLIACGVFLLMISLLGLIGAIRHQQICLFFYMIILFILFLAQFSLGCACLAMNKEQKTSLVKKGWLVSSLRMKESVQIKLDCCGYEDINLNSSMPAGHPACDVATCCAGSNASCCHGEVSTGDICPCHPCKEKLDGVIGRAFNVAGAIGLTFSFTEIIGIWLALRYRNLKDPRANPSAFL